MMALKILLASPLLLDVQGGGCLKHKNFQTVINYSVEEAPVEFTFHYNRNVLTRRSKERTAEWVKKNEGHAWLSGLGKEAKWHTEGVTKGSMRVETKFKMVAKPYDKYGVYYCPYVTHLNVTVHYASEILIAKEHEEGSCSFAAVMEHEFKHHDVNRTVVKTLAKRMEADTPKLLAFMENRYVMRDDVQKAFQRMQQGISDALKVYGEEMSGRMDEFNSHVDTPEEYRAVGQKCK